MIYRPFAFAIAVAISLLQNLSAGVFLGLTPLAGDNSSEGFDVSTAGAVAGASYIDVTSTTSNDPVRWSSPGTATGLGLLPGHQWGQALGISASGNLTVGSSVTSGGTYYAVSFRGGLVTNLGVLSGSGSGSTAHSVSGDGSIIVGSSSGKAFRWTSATGMQDLGTLSASGSTIANRISVDGQTIVGRSNATPFYWTSSTGMVGLASFAGGGGEARGVSADGSKVVGFSNANPFSVAALWVNGAAPIALQPHSGATSSFADDISEDGKLVVGNVSGNGDKATLWDLDTGIKYDLRSLLVSQGVDLSGWLLREATAISGDAISGYNITGTGLNPAGFNQAYLVTNFFVTPVPEPTSLVLVGMAFCGSYWCRRRRGGDANRG